MNIKNKKEYRAFAKQILNKQVDIKAKCAHYKMFVTLEKIIKFTKSKKILLYLPLNYEPNLHILKKKINRSCVILIPLMLDISFKMVKWRRPFKISRFNVKESLNQNEYYGKVDMAIVPVIGVDGNMARIGHGKGFYDMFFNALGYRPIIVFVQIKDLFVKDKISQDHDIRCDFYITPTKNYLTRGKYDRDYNRIRSRCGGRWCRIYSS